VRSDRRSIRPYGLYGGYPGAASKNYISRGGGELEVLPAKFLDRLRHGDLFIHELPGAGGWGDPLERDTARVLKDVRNGFVSLNAAEMLYGVILQTDSEMVEAEATTALRARMKSARGWQTVPFALREEPAAMLMAAAE
jgi:N-methylhydantoinase B